MLEGCLFFFKKPLRSQSFKISTIKISTNFNALRAKITKYMRKYIGKIFAVFFSPLRLRQYPRAEKNKMTSEKSLNLCFSLKYRKVKQHFFFCTNLI